MNDSGWSKRKKGCQAYLLADWYAWHPPESAAPTLYLPVYKDMLFHLGGVVYLGQPYAITLCLVPGVSC